MDNTSVSCIIPVFNGADHLCRAVDSALDQTHPLHEVIVVDDGSTDSTAKVAAGYGRRIRYFRQVNRGPAAARNTGLRTAAGKFATFLDADDYWHPEKLERQLSFLQTNPDIDLCFTYVQHLFDDSVAEEAKTRAGRALSRPMGYYAISSLMGRLAMFRRHPDFDESLRLGENMDWFLRLRSRGATVAMLEEPLCFRVFHSQSTSQQPGRYVETLFNVLRAWRRFKSDTAPSRQDAN